MGAPLLNIEYVIGFTLVFLRIGAILALMPVIGERAVPGRVKAGLALLIALLVFPTIRMEIPTLQADAEIVAVGLAMVNEMLIGVVIGFAVRIVFAGIQFAGNMIGLQMGLAIANVFDPVSSSQVSIMAEFQYLFAMLVYLAVDAHHLLIYAIVDSYRFVAPFGFQFSESLIEFIVLFSKGLFITAVKICAPVMAILLFSNVALGVVARTVPQINIFIVGMPLHIATGLIVLGLTIPFFASAVQRAFNSLNMDIQAFLRLM
jgi:flagellar biosynthetic protein FliR